MKSGPGAKVRCAIYTRVSTDQGLDQDFNSLDAQYEACSGRDTMTAAIPEDQPTALTCSGC